MRLSRIVSSRVRPSRVGLVAIAAAVVAASGLQHAVASEETSSRERTITVGAEKPLADLFAQLDPLVRRYDEHVRTLANPFFEGRSAGTRGKELAAEYLAFNFERMGLKPAFPSVENIDGSEIVTPESSFRQSFEVGGGVSATVAFAQVVIGGKPKTLVENRDFTVLGTSGDGAATGPVVFVGYSIESGPDGYTSFPEDTDLSGHIAMMFRFEPISEDGTSRWRESEGWTAASTLNAKVQAAISRGATGVILVNPPGADDPRINELSRTDEFRGRLRFPAPVVMMSHEAAGRLAAAHGASLVELRERADEGAVVEVIEGASVVLAAEVGRERVETWNVAALLPGSGDLAEELLVIGGHYDHVGYGSFGSRAGARGRGALHPGADDNASGTAGVLLLAEKFTKAYAEMGDEPRRSILFMGYGAEEMGLLGARHYVQNPIRPIEKHYAMINLDMIGYLRDGNMDLFGTGTAEEFTEILDRHIGSSGLTVRRVAGGTGPSDHSVFYGAGIPVLFFHTGLHSVYHMPEDISDFINRTGAVEVCRLAYAIASELVTREEALSFTRTGRGTMQSGVPRVRVNVRFGIAPGDYAGEEPGILVGEVFEGTSADLAGLKQGDLIVEWGGKRVETVEAWMPLLSEHNPGDEVEVVFVREGQRQTTTVVLQGRDQR
ncbi:MAG: M28 family peptidase [Phycisphaerales bacterium]|nr:MAG: M28 family peptidase [Phycisphaerales bacterium]